MELVTGLSVCYGFPGDSDSQESVCDGKDPGSIPGSGRSPGEGKGNPLQSSCLENPMDRGDWRSTCMHAKSLQLCLTVCDPVDCSLFIVTYANE